MKKTVGVLIALIAITMVAVIAVVYNNQDYVIISKNFYFSVEKDVEILYMEKQKTDEYGYNSYHVAIRVSDDEYEKIIADMKKAGYTRYDNESEWRSETMGWWAKNWIPLENVKSEVERYELATSKYIFPVSRIRLYPNVHITDSIDGYRELYMRV